MIQFWQWRPINYGVSGANKTILRNLKISKGALRRTTPTKVFHTRKDAMKEARSESVTRWFIENFDEIGKYLGNKKAARVWFFISPDGKTQSVIVNLIDQTNNENPYLLSLVLNPFSGQFEVYDSFQKP